MYNENENNYNTSNESNTEQGMRQDISTDAGINSSASQPDAAAGQTGTYSYTREQLENQWRPNTGTYFNDSSSDKKTAKNLKKAQKTEKKSQKRAAKKAGKKPVSGRRLAMACTASALAAVILSSGIMYGLYKKNIEDNYMLKSEYKSASIGNTGAALNNLSVLTSDRDDDGEYSVRQVAKAVLPSVVSITSTAIVESNYNPFFGGGRYQMTGAGSGIIVGKSDTELLIVTNNHVVEDTTSLTVEFVDGSVIDSAYVKGTNSSNDVAIVAIKIDDLDDDTIDAIKLAVMGDSDELQVGDGVVAIGNALGYGQSVTSGVVSALNRNITLDYGDLNVIQTDASINGGNSGGALVNRKGEVVGINVAKASQSSSSSASVEGMGYAIPISEVKDIINELMNKETKLPVAEDEKGYVGITKGTYVEVDESTSQMYNIPEGIYLREVNKGTPLDKAGVAKGDVITAVEGESVTTFTELQEQISYYAKGDTVTLTIQVMSDRSYKERKIDVTLVSYDELTEILK